MLKYKIQKLTNEVNEDVNKTTVAASPFFNAYMHFAKRVNLNAFSYHYSFYSFGNII